MLSSLRMAMVSMAYALLELEVREHGGENRGEVVDMIIEKQHFTPGPAAPWCAGLWATIYELACELCHNVPVFNPGMSTSRNVKLAETAGLLVDEPRRGDAACFKGDDYNTGYKHTGLVFTLPNANGDYTTIEGNAGDAIKLMNRNLHLHPATFIGCEGGDEPIQDFRWLKELVLNHSGQIAKLQKHIGG